MICSLCFPQLAGDVSGVENTGMDVDVTSGYMPSREYIKTLHKNDIKITLLLARVTRPTCTW